METTETNTIIKNRLKAFKEIVKTEALVRKERNAAFRSHQQWVSKTIHEPLIKAGKSTDWYSLYKSGKDEEIKKHWDEVKSTLKTDCCDYLAKFSAREIHFAYSLVRGRRPEEIEQKVAKGNEINMKNVDTIIIAVMGLIDFMGTTEVPMVGDGALASYRRFVERLDWHQLNEFRNRVFDARVTCDMFFTRK